MDGPISVIPKETGGQYASVERTSWDDACGANTSVEKHPALSQASMAARALDFDE